MTSMGKSIEFLVVSVVVLICVGCGPITTVDQTTESEPVEVVREGQVKAVPEYFEPLDPNYVERRRREACTVERERAVGQRLESLRQADQRDRRARTLSVQDNRIRREEVAKLMAEGCLATARDYHTSSLLFFHGETPDHFYLSFFWASRAVELGDNTAKWLIPRAIDQYLVYSGYKQIFGTQIVPVSAYRPNPTEVERREMCLWPVTSSMSDRRRAGYDVDSVEDRIKRVLELNNDNGINTAGVCKVDLPDPPRGLFEGIW